MTEPAAPNPPSEVTVEEALRIAQTMHRAGGLEDAEKLYRRILDAIPRHPDALHFLGLLVRQRGRMDEAIDLMRRAVEIAPDYVSAHTNLGNLYFERRDFPAAIRCFERVLELSPDDPFVHNNMGSVADACGHTDRAIACYERALELAPDFATPNQNLGTIHFRRGDIPTAHVHFCKAVVLDPGLSFSRQFVGLALCELGRFDEARDYYRKWMEEAPDNPVPRHMLAAVTPEADLPRATDDYVRVTFDSFADTFDTHLERLEYRAPQLVAEALAGTGVPAQGRLDVLDAGCGTGLCGPLLRPWARRLEGVDLSPGMLAKARSRGCYDELVESELTAHIAAHPDAFDVVTCADTFCYFGDLSAAARAAARSLRPGGHFVFSVEEALPGEADQSGYKIRPSGRYAHTEAYVRSVLADAGLEVTSLQHEGLRCEVARPVDGLIVVARRPAQERHGG